MEWVLNFNYQDMIQTGKLDVTATQLAFVLSQYLQDMDQVVYIHF
jgi:hypothetical protein